MNKAHMKILLLGEYSNVHATLARGLRQLGHKVTVVSNGDFWKDYPRDIDVSRRPGKLGGIMLMFKMAWLLPRLTGYDVVQLINPMFLELKAGRLQPIYKYLRRHNGAMVLGAFGMDYYWVHENITRMPLRYSDFNIGKTLRTDFDALREQHEWLGTDKGQLSQHVAQDCDAIVTGLYEYEAVYQPLFPGKTTFIPFPIDNTPLSASRCPHVSSPQMSGGGRLKLFIGISKNRSTYKGTDIMLEAAKAVRDRYPDRLELRVAEGVPFAQYARMMEGSDAICDQLYSYTPAMNALEAMSRGLVVVGGGEPENYEILGERELHPIVNVEPCRESVYKAIEHLVLHPEELPRLKRQSLEYIKKHHNYIKIAKQYEETYKKLI